MIINAGGVTAVVDYVATTRGNGQLSGIMMLCDTAAHTESLAMTVIVSKGINQLSIALNEETEDHILAATAWALGQIGRHTPKHAKAVVNILPKLLQLYSRQDVSEDLQTNDPVARRLFVTTGVLKKIQEIKTEEGSPLVEYIIQLIVALLIHFKYIHL